MQVIDRITASHGEDPYRQCAEDDIDTDLHFDPTGELSGRSAPLAIFTFAIARSPTYSRFWKRLQSAVSITADSPESLLLSDVFIATYGALSDTMEVPRLN